MYTLTLTLAERQAIDWVGNRYGHGDELYTLLWHDCTASPDDADWDSPQDITFEVPEFVVWDIYNIGEECDFQWDCFSEDFCKKLNEFCEKIV